MDLIHPNVLDPFADPLVVTTGARNRRWRLHPNPAAAFAWSKPAAGWGIEALSRARRSGLT